MGIIDEVIKESPGGAHRHKNEQIELVKNSILKNINEIRNTSVDILVAKRNEKYLNITNF